jgi:hypothetical protein
MGAAGEAAKPALRGQPCPTWLNRSAISRCGSLRTSVPPALAAYASV